mmetsp:Transcript_8542/g.10964  ORF Transcript_8542/g.10964 Transcript_8542/m.10964 type:complete len:387 (-) Transcript_8542:151-1311(-)
MFLFRMMQQNDEKKDSSHHSKDNVSTSTQKIGAISSPNRGNGGGLDDSFVSMSTVEDNVPRDKDIWITAVASPPIQSYPLYRALYLIQHILERESQEISNEDDSRIGGPVMDKTNGPSNSKTLRQRVTLLLPWIENSQERNLIYKNYPNVPLESGSIGRRKHAEFIRQWARKDIGMEREISMLRIRFYPARYDMETFSNRVRWVKEKEIKEYTSLRASSRQKFIPLDGGDVSRLPIALGILRAWAREERKVLLGDSSSEKNEVDVNDHIVHIDLNGKEMGYCLDSVHCSERSMDSAQSPTRKSSHDNVFLREISSPESIVKATQPAVQSFKCNLVKKEIFVPNTSNIDVSAYYIFIKLPQKIMLCSSICALVFAIWVLHVDERFLL